MTPRAAASSGGTARPYPSLASARRCWYRQTSGRDGCRKPDVPGWFLRHDGAVLDLTDYELAWPPGLFVAEASRILGRPGLGEEAIDLLLREAFRDENAAEDASSRTTST